MHREQENQRNQGNQQKKRISFSAEKAINDGSRTPSSTHSDSASEAGSHVSQPPANYGWVPPHEGNTTYRPQRIRQSVTELTLGNLVVEAPVPPSLLASIK